MKNTEFWQIVDKLVEESEIVIDRAKGSEHPKWKGFIYPLDYGYLKGSSSMDGDGIDVWVGSLPERKANAVICIVDYFKKDSEIKILLGCTDEEKQIIYNHHNKTSGMKGLLMERE